MKPKKSIFILAGIVFTFCLLYVLHDTAEAHAWAAASPSAASRAISAARRLRPRRRRHPK